MLVEFEMAKKNIWKNDDMKKKEVVKVMESLRRFIIVVLQGQ